MEHLGDQTKIHFNPEFISRGKTPLNPKVHVNPAFLQKSQGTLTAQKFVTPAAPVGGSTDHEQYLQGLTSGTSRPTTHISVGLLHMHNGNTDKHVYSQSSKIVNGCTVPSSCNPQSHSLYTKNNIYNPYNKNFSRYTKGLPQTQNIVAKKSFVGKHSSTYSWKAYNTNSWVPPNQGTSSTSVKVQGNVNLIQNSGCLIQQYTCPNPAVMHPVVNKSFFSTTKRIGPSQKMTQHNENKPTVPSSLHSNLPDINKSISQSVRGSAKVTRNVNPDLFINKTKTEIKPSKTVTQENSSKITENKTHGLLPVGQRISDEVTENRTQNFHLSRNKNEITASEKLAQNTRDILKHGGKALKNGLSKSSSASAVYASSSVAATQPVRFTPNRKWVSKTALVNSSKKLNQTRITDLKNNYINVAVKNSKQKGTFKIITKTKLVRTHSNSTNKSKLQQQAPVEVQSVAHSSKIAHCNSTRVTNMTKIQKLSPATRVHQTCTRFNGKRRYSVLSRTKLVRSQSLSGKAGTPGKPKYSVNTKNKLIRRQSNSDTGSSKSPSKASESKAKTNKPETERQKKFHVLSKTKIVRRRSNSGVYKTVSAQGLVALTPCHHKKRAIVKRHKLVRNVSSLSMKHDTTRYTRSLPKKVNTAFKVINTPSKLSNKQRIAKGIISKYKINRLKSDSPNNYKRYKKFFDYYSKSRQKNKFRFQNKKMCTSKHSDKFINIGGILYKSTKTSLQKQLPKTNYKAGMKKKPDSTCTVFLRGEKFHVTAGGRTLQRVKDSMSTKSSLPRVHIGGLTYSRTHTGLYELTKTHQARALLSSARQRSMVTLIQKRKKGSYQKRNEYCIFFNRFGRCSKKNRGECPYVHDPRRVAICTRFLRGRCPVNSCPFSHTIDPDKMPVCSHFLQAACTREDCPYRHVKVNPSAPVCLDFVRGHCKAGEECDKQHILVCEEFKTGKCPRGAACPLSHHKGKNRPRKVSTSRDSTRRTSLSIYRKRKRSESFEILGGPVIKKRVEKRKREAEASSSQQRYFHFAKAENSPREDTQSIPENGEHSGNGLKKVLHEEITISGSRILNSDIDNRVSNVAKGQRDEVQEDQVVHLSNYVDSPIGKSFFEETRSRVMKKVDQIKKSHIAFSNEDPTENTMDSLTHSMGDSKSEQSNEIREKPSKSAFRVTVNSNEASAQSCNGTENPISDSLKVQRPPLPKELPSYIPLTLDEN